MLAGFTRKKASTRRVNRNIAEPTRNQRVFFSRYLAANYGSCAAAAGSAGGLYSGSSFGLYTILPFPILNRVNPSFYVLYIYIDVYTYDDDRR